MMEMLRPNQHVSGVPPTELLFRIPIFRILKERLVGPWNVSGMNWSSGLQKLIQGYNRSGHVTLRVSRVHRSPSEIHRGRVTGTSPRIHWPLRDAHSVPANALAPSEYQQQYLLIAQARQRNRAATMPGNFAPFEAKMRADGLSDAAVAAFKNAYDALTSGG